MMINYAVIINTHLSNGTTYYSICCGSEDVNYVVLRRYSDFVDLDNLIRRKCPCLPLLPPKKFKWWTNHLDEDFVKNRQESLQQYLQRLIECNCTHDTEKFKNFFSINFYS